MKHIILTLFISILFCVSIAAQQERMYTKNLDAFTGTWEYKTENELFRIVFIKGKDNSEGRNIDCIIGGYLYIKNKDTIGGDYTKNIPVKYSHENKKDVTIFGTNALSSLDKVNPNQIRLIFTDRKIGKKTWGNAGMRKISENLFEIIFNWFTLLSSTEARLELFNDEGEDLDQPEEFSVPVNVIMKKVK
ncbi:MAG: hypothetical protein LBG80_15745 [Bacteroidales bacterium]|jgi:hypothetical protein|nr:hypothetical protein [Bacteroidales bacterium]